jgi:hypothetical protein
MKQKKYLLVPAAALVLLIAGAVSYIHFNAPTGPAVVESQQSPTFAANATEGEIEVVTAPPSNFRGQLSPDAPPESFSSNPPRDIEEQIILDLAIDRTIPDETKVERMLAMIPTIPDDAKVLAMENATALIPDSKYDSYRPRLHQLAQNPELREAVMLDALTRGEEVRLPGILDLLRTATREEERTELREILEAYLDHDYGPTAATWEAPLKKWLAEHADVE